MQAHPHTHALPHPHTQAVQGPGALGTWALHGLGVDVGVHECTCVSTDALAFVCNSVWRPLGPSALLQPELKY